MTDALSNLMKLPEWCYGLLNSQTVRITRGANAPLPMAIPSGQVDVLNTRMNVTISQRLAMEAGVTFGWNVRAADPDTHATPLEDEECKTRTYTVIFPIQHVVLVNTYNEAQALRQAEIVHDDGDFQVLHDGQPYIIDIKD